MTIDQWARRRLHGIADDYVASAPCCRCVERLNRAAATARRFLGQSRFPGQRTVAPIIVASESSCHWRDIPWPENASRLRAATPSTFINFGPGIDIAADVIGGVDEGRHGMRNSTARVALRPAVSETLD
jgi:hypothetical protein